MKFGTKTVHAGAEPDPSTGAIMTPIYQTSTYVQEAPGVNKGYEYARTSNPTRTALEKAFAALENAKYALAFASGMGAIDAIVHLLKPGDEVLVSNDLYGGTYRLFSLVYEAWGIKFKYVDMRDAAALAQHFTDATRMIWFETPTNPLLSIIDIRAVAEQARARGVWTVLDNTFASPFLQNPLDMGIDISVHSATKYLGGHSDVIMGAIMLNDAALYDKLKFFQKSMGAVPGPMDCFLAMRGLKTLHLRMERHCQNARAVAQFLSEHPKVSQVLYPGLPAHPNHSIAKAQMRDFGGMISFMTKGDTVEEGKKVLAELKLFSLAESLGGVESLVGHPASMTHASIPEAERVKAGLKNSLLRLSVGVEDVEDLIEDLRQALDKL